MLFGHHFAAIAGAGPLVGPVLAAQMGYLPGALWLMIGVVFAGAVQDMLVLFISTRRDGRSLGDLVKTEMGEAAGLVAMFGILAIMVILLAVLGLVVIKALADSPWGAFTVFATLPIAVFMGVYGRYLRPGRIFEMSLIGFALLIASLALGREVAQSETLAPLFTFKGETLAFMLIAYGFVASVLPVWLLLAPRDYLSTFLKIGTIISLAIGIFIVWPDLKMPAISRFVDGTGPVFAGSLFPFLFITIACGAVSGFHALVSSGTTPKMIGDETQIPFIGYGAMLMESFVAIMALCAACVLEPGVYFAMNSAPALIGSTPEAAANVISGWGFAITPQGLADIAAQVGEKSILSRTGGAPTLAVGMAKISPPPSAAPAPRHSGIISRYLFEALFILTTIDAGTRVARFMIQDLVGNFVPSFNRSGAWIPNLTATALAVTGWGWFLYQGVVDPLGGINTLWPLFGIANQMLAAIALTLCSVVLFRMKRESYAFIALLPTAWLYICTLTAGVEKIFHPDIRIGFLAHAATLWRGAGERQTAGAGQEHAGDAAHRLQRLSRRFAGGAADRAGADNGRLRPQGDARRAAQRSRHYKGDAGCSAANRSRLDLSRLATKLRAGASLMVGQPDYDVYAKHRRENYPGDPIMSREEFFLERQARRFGEGGERAFRCC